MLLTHFLLLMVVLVMFSVQAVLVFYHLSALLSTVSPTLLITSKLQVHQLPRRLSAPVTSFGITLVTAVYTLLVISRSSPSLLIVSLFANCMTLSMPLFLLLKLFPMAHPLLTVSLLLSQQVILTLFCVLSRTIMVVLTPSCLVPKLSLPPNLTIIN